MKSLYRKMLRRLGLYGKFKTEMIGNYKVTYDSSTDIRGNLYKGYGFESKEIDISCKYIKPGSISYLENMGYKTNRIIGGDVVEFCSDSQYENQYYNYIFFPTKLECRK